MERKKENIVLEKAEVREWKTEGLNMEQGLKEANRKEKRNLKNTLK